MDRCACTFNCFLTSSDLCRLLITYASSLDQDQNQWKKVNFEKKESRRQQKYEKLPSMQRVKERFDARAISAIRRQAVKCSAETAQLARTTSALFCYSCNKYLFLIGRFVTDVQPVKTQKGLTIRAFSQVPSMRANTTFIHQS